MGPAAAMAVSQGQRLPADSFGLTATVRGRVRILREDQSLLAVAELTADGARPLRVFAPESLARAPDAVAPEPCKGRTTLSGFQSKSPTGEVDFDAVLVGECAQSKSPKARRKDGKECEFMALAAERKAEVVQKVRSRAPGHGLAGGADRAPLGADHLSDRALSSPRQGPPLASRSADAGRAASPSPRLPQRRRTSSATGRSSRSSASASNAGPPVPFRRPAGRGAR